MNILSFGEPIFLDYDSHDVGLSNSMDGADHEIKMLCVQQGFPSIPLFLINHWRGILNNNVDTNGYVFRNAWLTNLKVIRPQTMSMTSVSLY